MPEFTTAASPPAAAPESPLSVFNPSSEGGEEERREGKEGLGERDS
jgi:hypothetical protein